MMNHRRQKNKLIKLVVFVSVILLTVATAYAAQDEALEQNKFYEGSFVLSAAPGFYAEAFDLTISIPTNPDAIIYYTIDGNEPTPSEDRWITRGEKQIRVSGNLPQSGQILVEDRSGYWKESILTYHHADQFTTPVVPVEGTEILQGTSYRFRGFVDGEPVTETITATYIIAPNAGTRFTNMPIVAITAPYEDFIHIYKHSDPFDPVTHRRIFNYEYFEQNENRYERVFSLPGSTQLGGNGTRGNSQRTFNVHLSRGELDGVITHPIFSGLDELYRFRLWNGGNAFEWDHMRDPFTQTASAELSVPYAEHSLAIMFVNGEFWGFTTLREHTSNAHFTSTRLGIDMDNVVLFSRTWRPDGVSTNILFDELEEGNEDIAWALYNEVVDFAKTHDLSTDYARERLFDEFFDQENFMDYFIANTFFANTDWPNNNMRFFRAIEPVIDTNNPYNDGKWRFILHDMDWSPHPNDYPNIAINRFESLYSPWITDEMKFSHVLLIFNNKIFVEQFRERALYILENQFEVGRLSELHREFILRYLPLLPEMYNRFPIVGNSVAQSIVNFNTHWWQVSNFYSNRGYYYREQLDELLERLQGTI